MSGLLQHGLERQARERPNALAVLLDDEALTYQALDEISTRLARALQALGCEQGDRVCLLAYKTPLAIASMLAALKADAVYVPVDPTQPPARVARTLAACDTPYVLAAPPAAALLDAALAEPDAPRALRVGWLGPTPGAGARFTARFCLADLDRYPARPPTYRNTPADPAHILFTSGSTGLPKGVVITHANVDHFLRWAVEYFDFRPGDRHSGHPPLHFDLSTFDIYGAFAAGAELHLMPAELSLQPARLAAFIRERELTQWFSVPSLLSYLARFEVVAQRDFPHLKRLLWCGEVFPTPALIYWMRRLPHVRFTNLYGPTEATIASSYYTLPACPTDEEAAVPIGRPCPGEELLVLDEALRPLPPGAVGDLYLAGVGLSPGYWRDPERTAQAFLADPRAPGRRLYRTGDLARQGEDGLFYFLGRADWQIKSRGYRIELGEIEAALSGLALVAESAVVPVRAAGFEGTAIGCAYSPLPGQRVTPGQLRSALSKALPAYMLPGRWLELPSLPRNANGKIDRRRLMELLAEAAR